MVEISHPSKEKVEQIPDTSSLVELGVSLDVEDCTTRIQGEVDATRQSGDDILEKVRSFHQSREEAEKLSGQ